MDNGKLCSTDGKQGCCGRFALAVAAGFVAIFAFEWFYHGVLLMPAYEQTAELWRPKADMQHYFGWVLASHLAKAFILAWIFIQHYEGKGISEGLHFGLYAGFLMGIVQFVMVAYVPFPSMTIPLLWLAGGLLEGAIAGVVIAAVWHRCGKRDGKTNMAA